jgi:SAM-dependent methyltransferase
MGLSVIFLKHLCDLKKRGDLDGSTRVVEIGAQQLSNSFLRADALLTDCYRLFGCEQIHLGEPATADYQNGVELMPEKNPSSRGFWQSLGFTYTSIEFEGYRDSIALDLNRDDVPQRFRSAFDLVVNTGTTEHVANQENAFRVMHDLCRPGGIMLHMLPSGGMMTHGLITYTPRFFWLLCRENRYEPRTLLVTSYPANPVPTDIRNSNIQFGGIDPIPPDLLVPDFEVVAALRKAGGARFVIPLDVPPEIAPGARPIRRRLWSFS